MGVCEPLSRGVRRAARAEHPGRQRGEAQAAPGAARSRPGGNNGGWWGTAHERGDWTAVQSKSIGAVSMPVEVSNRKCAELQVRRRSWWRSRPRRRSGCSTRCNLSAAPRLTHSRFRHVRCGSNACFRRRARRTARRPCRCVGRASSDFGARWVCASSAPRLQAAGADLEGARAALTVRRPARTDS